MAELQKELAAAELLAEREQADREAEEAALARIAARGKSEEEAREKRDRTGEPPGPDLGSTEDKVGTPVPEVTEAVAVKPEPAPKPQPRPITRENSLEIGTMIMGWTLVALVGWRKKDGACLYRWKLPDESEVIGKRTSAGKIWYGAGGVKWPPPDPESYDPAPATQHEEHTIAPALTEGEGTSLQTAVDL
jgi:hypothetical protein